MKTTVNALKRATNKLHEQMRAKVSMSTNEALKTGKERILEALKTDITEFTRACYLFNLNLIEKELKEREESND